MNTLRLAGLLLLICAPAACSRPRNSGAESANVPLTGTWVGDFGPAFYDRNTITVELNWDGKSLTGMIRPGVPGGRMYRNFEGFGIENGSFDPATGAVKFEAVYRPRNRHYVIEGRLKGNTLSGRWNRPEERGKDGDFKLMRQN